VLEGKFQWQHAKDLNPEPEDLAKIEAKLKDGLPELGSRRWRPVFPAPAARP
jgi:hypothetical protein